MGRKIGWLAILLVSCTNIDGSTHPIKPPAPPVVRQEIGRYHSQWEQLKPGECPLEFTDVRLEGHSFPWLYDGNWQIIEEKGKCLLRVPNALTAPEEPLTFRRYIGNAFGPLGLLPLRYRVEAKGRSLGGAKRFNGFGELAIQVFYLDPTHYVEVLHTDQHLRVWLADGAEPGSGEGWFLLGQVDHPTPIGTWITFGAEVDIPAGTVRLLLDGKIVGIIDVPYLDPVPHSLTLRATGNREDWAWLKIEKR